MIYKLQSGGSIFNRISNPQQTYIDGYGVTRNIFESPIITTLRKVYNSVDRFLNGPTEEEYHQMGFEKPKTGTGTLDWVNPAKQSVTWSRVGKEALEKYKNLDGTQNLSKIFDDFLKGRKEASKFLSSDIKKATDKHNAELAKSLGYSFLENTDAVKRVETPMKKTIPGDWLQRGTNGGFYIDERLKNTNSLGLSTSFINPEQDKMILSGLGDIGQVSMHEHLHRGHFGEAPFGLKPGEGAKAADTERFYEYLTDLILDKSLPFDEAMDYLSKPGEAATNLLETGLRAGLKIGEEYPGDEKAIEIFKEIIANDKTKGPVLKRFKWSSSPKEVWKALTGRYYTILPLLGITTIKKENGRNTH